MENWTGILPFILIALVFWLLIVRPQRKRQRELVSTQSSIGPGTEVMLGSGIYGTVASLDDETIQLELSPGTTVKVARQAVVKVVTREDDTTFGLDDPETQRTRDPDTDPDNPDTDPGPTGSSGGHHP